MLINPYRYEVAGGGGPIEFRAASALEDMPTFGGTVTLDKPSGTVEDDIMFAWFAMENVNAAGWPTVTCSGWSDLDQVPTATGTFFQLRVLYKIAGASEPTEYDFAVGNPPPLFSDSEAGMLSFSGADPAGPFDDWGVQENTASNNVTCPALTASVTDTMLVCFFAGTDGNATAPPIIADVSMTTHQATLNTDYSHCTVASEAITDAGSTGTRVGNYDAGASRPSRCMSVLLKKA